MSEAQLNYFEFYVWRYVYKNMNWLPLHLRRKVHLSSYMLKILSGQSPSNFINKFKFISGGSFCCLQMKSEMKAAEILGFQCMYGSWFCRLFYWLSCYTYRGIPKFCPNTTVYFLNPIDNTILYFWLYFKVEWLLVI